MNRLIPPKQLAMDIAGRSIGHERYQIGAVLVDRSGRIFSWGWAHPAYHKPSIHAEHHALSRANPSRLAGATIYVAGIRRHKDQTIISKPCVNCQARLKWAGVTQVIHTTHVGWEGYRLE